MPLYQFHALNQSRQDVKGELDAATVDEAVARIRDMGLFPTSLKEKYRKPAPGPEPLPAPSPPTHKWTDSLPFFRVSPRDLIYFTRQFATMQDAGLSILRALQTLHGQQKPGPLRRALKKMLEDIAAGATLAEAMARHPRVFDPVYVKLVAAGETGGVLESVLNRLADTKESNRRMKRKIIRAMIYPTLIMIVSALILIIIMVVVVPLVIQGITDSGATLPAPLQILRQISHWFTGGVIPGWILILLTPPAAWFGLTLIKESRAGRMALDSFKLKIPLIGKITRKLATVRFTRIMGTLINAGVPIVEAIRTSRDVTGNEVFNRALAHTQDLVREGEPFADSIKAARVFDTTVINMIEVGDETGELDKVLLKVADNYEEEADMLIGALTTILGPAMFICIAIVIALIIVGMFVSVLEIVFRQA